MSAEGRATAKRESIIAAIGQTICGTTNDAQQRHRCREGNDDFAAGCIQTAIGGVPCLPYKQARAVMELLENGGADGVPLVKAIRASLRA